MFFLFLGGGQVVSGCECVLSMGMISANEDDLQIKTLKTVLNLLTAKDNKRCD